MADPEPTPPRVALSPYCVHLSSKKLLLGHRLPMRDEDVLDASNHCWCRVTQKVIGPDKQPVVPADCQSGRACYVSPFSGAR
jgi:hypothetical protein